MKRIPVNEQETTIQFDRDGELARIWTTDTTIMTRIDKLVDDPESPWECIDVGYCEDESGLVIVSKEYRGLKSLITIRSKKVKLTEEQRKIMADRARESFKKLQPRDSEDN